MTKKNKIKVALADDHVLLIDALARLVDSFEGFEVIFTVYDGRQIIDKVTQQLVPDIMITDLQMPNIDGHDAACWLQKHYPSVKVLILTMYDTELTLIRLIHAGVKGFLKKDIPPSELKNALHTVLETGYYYQQSFTGMLANMVRQNEDNEFIKRNTFTEIEIQFIKLSCTEMTYKEIAITLNLSPRTINYMRDNVFLKIDVKSRVGIAFYAIRNGLVSV